jgi:hypothetical protein
MSRSIELDVEPIIRHQFLLEITHVIKLVRCFMCK